jgi:hypothetical protein
MPEHQKPSAHSSIWKRISFRWFLVILAVLGALIALAAAGHEEFLFVLFLFPFVFAGGRIFHARRAKRKADQLAEQEEATDPDKYERQHQEIVETARHQFAQAPVGCWQLTLGFSHMFGSPTISQQRRIEFHADGTGLYQGISVGGLNTPIRVGFRHKPAPHPRCLLVQLIEPELKGWHEVKFDFEARITPDGNLLLQMWLEGDNPLPSPLEELWPFHGDFLRESS